MRHTLLGFFAAALAASAIVIGCTANGGTTVIQGGGSVPDGGDEASDNPFANLEAGTTKKDSGLTQPGDYDALFGPPSTSTTTPGSIFGLWAGKNFSADDMRIEFGSSQILIALKCGSASAVGGTIAANVSASSIKTLETKTIGSGGCSLNVSPDELSSCTATAGAKPCFNVASTKLDLSSFFDVSGTLTKLSD